MTDSPKRNFLGIPIDGDVTRGDKRVPQRPLEDLQPIIQAVLDDPDVVEFGWSQNTPYFNDGDPCVFSTNSVWVRTQDEVDLELDGGDELDVDYNSHPSLSQKKWGKDGYVPVKLSPAKLATSERCTALDAAVQGGAFNDVLMDAFGDHAEITIRREGIQVEYYEHD